MFFGVEIRKRSRINIAVQSKHATFSFNRCFVPSFLNVMLEKKNLDHSLGVCTSVKIEKPIFNMFIMMLQSEYLHPL